MGFNLRFGRSSTSAGKSGGAGCLILFGGVFFAVGVFMSTLLFNYVSGTYQARSWKAVPVSIISADLESHSDSDGGTTYEAVAHYQYDYDGQQYESERVSFNSGADNIGSFQNNAYRELKQHLDSGKPFMARVNPDNPSEAVLYPDIRIEMLIFHSVFVLVFGGAGLGIIIAGILSLRKNRNQTKLASEHPAEPWLQKEEWAEGRVVDSNRGGMIGIIIFAVFWNLISFPIAFFIGPDERAEAGKAIYLVYLFPAIGTLMIIAAAYQIARYLKYGRSIFEMTSLPGVIGGALSGIVHTKRNIIPEDGFHLTLNCIHQYQSGSGKNRSTHEDVLWQDERTMEREALEQDLTKSAIPVLFAIPFDSKPSDITDSSNRIFWRLEVKAKTRGIDYSAKFEVPVFKTEDSTENFTLDESAIEPYVRKSEPDQAIAALGARRTDTVRGSLYTFPPANALGVAIGISVFTAIWTGAVWLMLSLDAPILFPIIFGVIDIFLVYWMLNLWLHTSRIETWPGGMRCATGWLIPGKPRELSTSEIDNIDLKNPMRSGTKVYYTLALRLRNGKKINLASHLQNKRNAEMLVDMIESEMGQEND